MPKKKGSKKRKHVPQRTCVGCREVNAKRELIRIVRTPEGVRVDPDGKMAGRGAYLHDTPNCWQLGLNQRLARALKTEITAEDLAILEQFSQTLSPDSALSPDNENITLS